MIHGNGRRLPSALRSGLGLLAASWAASCASAPPVPVGPDLPTLGISHLEERALMLLLADRKMYDSFTVDRIRRVPSLKAELALTVGRAEDRRGRLALEELTRDADVEVRRAATFGLGLMGDPDSAPTLRLAARDGDREVGRLAVEALARIGVDLDSVVEALAALPAIEIEARLLPSLFRFEAEAVLPVAVAALESSGAGSYTWSAYALARKAHPDGAAVLRLLVDDPDPWLRGWAARGLGAVGEGSDLAALRGLLDDPAAGPVIQALRAAAQLIADGRAAAPEAWVPRLLSLLEDERAGVRSTTLEVAGGWLLNEDLGAALAAVARGADGREAELAIGALAAGGDPRAGALVRGLAGSGRLGARIEAARAAAAVGDLDTLEGLAKDAEAPVRAAAFGELFEVEAGPWLETALDDPDPGVRAAALEWLTETPSVDARKIALAMSDPRGEPLHDVAAAGIRALAALAQAQPATESEVLLGLTTLAEAGGYLTRRSAVEALRDLGFDVAGAGPMEAVADVSHYEALVQRTRTARVVRLETSRGAVDVELECDRAPRTCASFLQLAGQGFYDGLLFHRVVPDFVVQAGDRRRDGRGGPGYALRDEETRIPFERGVLGMATSGPDTAGSQFFITLSRQPHLDGEYTAFGHVVAGDEVLDELRQGDAIVRAYEVVEGVG